MRNLRILLVDDEPPILNGLQHHVPWNELAYEVVAASTTAREALSVLRDRPVDVILSDIRMPGLDGLELCRIARHEYPDLFVIFLTAHRDFDFAQRAVELGAWRFLLKPTDFSRLYLTLKELRRFRCTQQNAHNESHRGNTQMADSIIQWVEGHIQEASLQRAAAEVGLNPQYVSRRFFDQTGVHFSELVQRTRMEYAARLLRNSKYRTYEISRIVGYSSPKNFTRRFRDYFGRTPSAFRNSVSAGNGT